MIQYIFNQTQENLKISLAYNMELQSSCQTLTRNPEKF